MQNKGAIRLFAILMALICVYQLSFTLVTNNVERRALEYANSPEVMAQAKKMAKGDAQKERFYFDSLSGVREREFLDSMSTTPVYNILIRKYTYKECKERELNLGLDLKGGMNVTLEVSVVDIIRAMSNNSTDSTFNKAIRRANEMHKTSSEDFVTLFGKAFKEIDPKARLAAIFSTVDLKEKINFNTPDDQVLKIIREETDAAFDRTFNILRTRIDKFGVTQPNIQKLASSNRIMVELPGVKDPERVRKILQGTAKLEFQKTFEFAEVYPFLEQANTKLIKLLSATDTTAKVKTDTTTAKLDTVKKKKEDSLKAASAKTDTAKKKKNAKDQTKEEYAKENPLFAILQPAFQQDEKGNYKYSEGPVCGYVAIKDTGKVNRYLAMKQVQQLFPKSLRFAWTVKPMDKNGEFLELVALKVDSRDGKAALEGDVVVDARQDYGQNNSVEVSMTMNSEGATRWKKLTGDNIGKCIAIVLDNYVYSYPRVNDEIPNGRSSITGTFTIEEGKDLANVLKTGKLPAPARIVEEAIVGPTLGQEAINAGMWSFIAAFLLTMLYMFLYYNRAGLVANVALFVNMFFVFGILASLGAVLTLPGIAGIVLTLGMDVDKNVIIYERIREEIRAGKGMRLAIDDGYKHAYSSIIDSNIITLLIGIVLYNFGSGPVQGFATTLIIGVVSSMFCAIFITRLLFIWMLDRNITINVWHNFSKNFLTNTKIDFIGLRKKFYIFSLILMIAGGISLGVKGLSRGIDFLGGRSYVVRFDQNIKTDDLRLALKAPFGGKEPEVKIFGPSNQVKITTSYLIDERTTKADSSVEVKLFEGVKKFYKTPISYGDFSTHSADKVLGKLSSQKVEPTIAYSLLQKAFMAVLLSMLIIFVYVAIRFKKWQWGLGAVVSLFHDTFIVISLFSIFNGILPFSLDIDQHFIAAILTILGYSIMDSVIIFDRIREYLKLYPKRDMHSNMNDAINSTLGRTLNTSGITFMVLLAMFIFGGEVIRGFSFALLIGVVIGTYSSVFNATPIAYDTIKWLDKRKLAKESKKVKK
ncbi:MAG: protein translocase subunit SecDF [Bacteroidota bacterium]